MAYPHHPTGAVSGFLALALMTAVIPCAAAHAEPVDYTERAIASGRLNGVYFDSEVTITVAADTTDVTQPAPGIFAAEGIASISIAGGATAVFADQLTAFANNNTQSLGIADVNVGLDVLDTLGALGGPFDLSTAIGPVSGHAYINELISFDTSLGMLSFGSATTSTFTATQQSVPEPASFAILVVGLASFPLVRRVSRWPCRSAAY